MIVLAADFKILAATGRYLSAANATEQKIIGKDFFEVFPLPDPADAAYVREALETAVRTRAIVESPPRKYDVRGEARYWSVVNVPILGARGEIEYIIRRADDVTGILKKESEFKTASQERDIFFTHSFDLMAVVGTDGYFKRVNPSFERVMGYSESELYAKPIVDFLHPEDVAKTQKGIQTLAGGTPRIASLNRYRCKDGAYRWFSWNTTPMGALLYTLGRDVTDQILLEERTAAQIQHLQKMDAVGRLAGGIAHDFNNILGAVSITCELLREEVDEPDLVRARIQELLIITERAAALTRQLLLFSRPQTASQRTINLNPVIGQLEKMLLRLIGENIEVRTRLSPDLKSVSADPSQIEQVILNLVVNARDAMPDGGRIFIETDNITLDETFVQSHVSVEKGQYVVLSVTDTGCGMDAETQTKIFEPFFTTKPVGKGTGMGLSTTYGIVKQCKGTIWVYSELGKGTVFKIYLPVSGESAAQSVAAKTTAAQVDGNETVLLVEDDEALRKGFSSMLNKRGYQVLVAANGAGALELLKQHPGTVHLLLTDMVMPGLSGIDLAEHATALKPGLKVIYMSGYNNEVIEHSKIKNFKELDFVQKPFTTESLLKKVREVLSR